MSRVHARSISDIGAEEANRSGGACEALQPHWSVQCASTNTECVMAGHDPECANL